MSEKKYKRTSFLAPLVVLAVMIVAGQLLGERYRFLSSTTSTALVVLAAALEGYAFFEESRGRFARALFAAAVLVAVATIVEIAGVTHLIALLFSGTQTIHGSALLASGAYSWASNVLTFGLWFWLIDRGGPPLRAMGEPGRAEFFFPEMAAGQFADPRWNPGTMEYMYLAFTNATAFSPTDTLPLSGRARALMTAEAAISLVVIALVTARAVNILS